MRYKCVVRNFWGGIFYSPAADGRMVYEGDETPPASKNGTQYFIKIDDKEPVLPDNSGAKPPVIKPDERMHRKWELQKLNKIELQLMLKNKWKLDFDDRTTRDQLIDEVIKLQDKSTSNQDIVAQVKG